MSIKYKISSVLSGHYKTTLVGNNSDSIARWAKMTGIALATVVAMSAAAGIDNTPSDIVVNDASGFTTSFDGHTPDMDDRFSFEGGGLSYDSTAHSGNNIFTSDAGGEHFERGKKITIDVLNALSGERAQNANIYIVDAPSAVDSLDNSDIDLSKPVALTTNGKNADREDLIISLADIGDNTHFGGLNAQNADFKSYHEAFHGVQYLDDSGLDNNLRLLAGDSQSSAGYNVQELATAYSADNGHSEYQANLSAHVMADYVDHQYENGADVFAILAMHMDLEQQHTDKNSPDYETAKGDLNEFVRGVMSDRQLNFANDAAHGTAPILNQLRKDLHQGNIDLPADLVSAAKMTPQYLEDNKQLALDGFIKNYQQNLPSTFSDGNGKTVSMDPGDEGVRQAMSTIEAAATHAHDQLVDEALSINASADTEALINNIAETPNLNLSLDLAGVGITIPKKLAEVPSESQKSLLSDRLEKLREANRSNRLTL